MSPTNQLVGWVSSNVTGEVHIQETHDNRCERVRRCPTILLPATAPHAGGTGYDPRFQAAWSSDGLSISLDGLRDCARICGGAATLMLGGISRVSGLAVGDAEQRLYQLETVAGQYAVTVYDIRDPRTRCFTVLTRCAGKTLTPTGLAGGLAYDEVRRLLYIGTTEASPAGPMHVILVVRSTDPCTILCKYEIPGDCLSANTVLTGLAYDNCKAILYATNGVNNLEILVGNPLQCAFKIGRCCPSSGRYGGLALLPGWRMDHVGRSCLRRPCADCPDMHMTTSGGDPSLGNTAFALNLVNAPGGAGQIAGIWLRAGGCTPGFPFLCSTFHADPLFGPFIVPIVGAGCNGVATWPVPLGVDPQFCGVQICVQAIVVCPATAGPAGVGMSDAIQFTITN